MLKLENYSIKEQLDFFFFSKLRNYFILLEPWLEPGNYSASLKSRSYSIFVGFVAGTRELLDYFLLKSKISFRIKDLLSFVKIKNLLNFTRIKDILSLAGIKDLLSFAGIKDLLGFASWS